MNLIQKFNESYKQQRELLNEQFVSFDINCLTLDCDTKQVCESAVKFLTKLSADILGDAIVAEEVQSKMGLFSVLKLLPTQQSTQISKLDESMSIRSLIAEKSENGYDKGQNVLLEALGALKTTDDESGIALRRTNIGLYESDKETLCANIDELNTQYQSFLKLF